jgi:diguanylate cyclase (GGDEF)-like protein/PAS domain S-box-containing protein
MPVVQNNLAILEAAFQQDLHAVIITDADLSPGGPHIVMYNEAFCRMTGYGPEELLGRSPKILQGPQSDRAMLADLWQSLLAGRFFHGKTVNYRKDGTTYHVEWNISPVYDRDGTLCNFASVQKDITAQVQAERERDMLAQALHASLDPVMITDANDAIVFVNKGFERLTGYTSAEVLGHNLAVLHACEADDNLKSMVVSAGAVPEASGQLISCRRKDGKTLYTLQSKTPVGAADDSLRHTVCVAKDITLLVKHQQHLRNLAEQDKLTGLLNRHAGESALTEAFEEAQASRKPYAMISCDIDHFKRINDGYGHPVGDLVLVKVAQLLLSALRQDDLCFRWGGEEFLILLPGASLPVASKLANRLRQEISAASLASVGQVTLSFGVAESAPDEPTASLLDRVDKALYAAKSLGRNRVEVAQPAA